jgi:hypothetical protein
MTSAFLSLSISFLIEAWFTSFGRFEAKVPATPVLRIAYHRRRRGATLTIAGLHLHPPGTSPELGVRLKFHPLRLSPKQGSGAGPVALQAELGRLPQRPSEPMPADWRVSCEDPAGYRELSRCRKSRRSACLDRDAAGQRGRAGGIDAIILDHGISQ